MNGLVGVGLLALGLWLGEATPAGQQAATPGNAKRPPWTTSRITGSPEPAPPFKVTNPYPKLRFKFPTVIARAPGTDRLFVAEQYGKIFSIRKTAEGGESALFVDLVKDLKTIGKTAKAKEAEAIYGLAFHPDFEKNRYCYICYVLKSTTGEALPDGSRVSRFRVTATEPPRVETESEEIVLTFLAGGHNGGCLEFGPDRKLYITTGDGAGPYPPDTLRTGQNVSDLLSSILRIDVDRRDPGQNYGIPTDNPFVGQKGVRGEIWAYGFRNPWKMTFDRTTGEMWVGDVGWELWELIQQVQKGGNYGWSVTEGRQPVYPDEKPGPTPILAPAIELPHTVSASVTGGYVYRGKKFPPLQGAYIFGDWEFRRIWAARKTDKGITYSDLVDPTVRVVAFGEDNAGELTVADYDLGTIHEFEPNDRFGKPSDFPRKLSQTGLFNSLQPLKPMTGVLGFDVNSPQWVDQAQAHRLVALPGSTAVTWSASDIEIPGSMFRRQLAFPNDAVLVKSLDVVDAKTKQRRWVETQILHYDGRAWRPYTYAWNESQTDADLVDSLGASREIDVLDPSAPGGKRRQTWTYASRNQCLLCHNPWAQHTLAFNVGQLNRPSGSPGDGTNQLARFEQLGVFARQENDGKASPVLNDALLAKLNRLPDPKDAKESLDRRARSYLHANCSHCHQFGGGGAVELHLLFNLPMAETKTVQARPLQGTFGIAEGRIITPGDPYRSVLFYRVSKVGRGRMPHLGSEVVDEAGVRLLYDWISQLKPISEELDWLDRLLQVGDKSADASKRAEWIGKLLGSTAGSLRLADTMRQKRIPPAIQHEILIASQKAEPVVRDLFESFHAGNASQGRLGSSIRPEMILPLVGDAKRGAELFQSAPTLQCKNCHRIGSSGKEVGPELTKIGAKRTRSEILENILEPSKTIEPAFATYLVQKTDGQNLTGVVVQRDGKEVVLRDNQGNSLKIPVADIEGMRVSRQSLMPDGLLRDLTPQQAADLVDYLSSLR